MKLLVSSDLSVPPATAWELFESEEFQARLEDQAGVKAELLEAGTEGPVQVRRYRYTSKTELPAFVAKIFGSPYLSYEQTSRLDLAASRLDWTLKLPGIGERVKVGGATTISPTAGGCRRVVDGEIVVSVPLIGGQVEKAVVAEFEKSMGKAVDIVRAMITERGLA